MMMKTKSPCCNSCCRPTATRFLAAYSGEEAIGIFANAQIDLVLAKFAIPTMDGNELIVQLKQMVPRVPMILFGDPNKMADLIHSADAVLDPATIPTGELLERIRIMTKRKRGPRKGCLSSRTKNIAPPVATGYDGPSPPALA